MMDDVSESTMTPDAMKARTRTFALRVIKLVGALPRNPVADVLGRQLMKSGTSIGANYREAQHASSRRHFATTLEIAQREADESLYWLELIATSGIIKPARIDPLQAECAELLSILTAAVRRAKRPISDS